MLAHREVAAKELDHRAKLMEIQNSVARIMAEGGVDEHGHPTEETREKVREAAGRMQDLVVDRALHAASRDEFSMIAARATLERDAYEREWTPAARNRTFADLRRKMEMTKRFKFINPRGMRERMRRQGREWAFFRFADAVLSARFSEMDPENATVNRLIALSTCSSSIPRAALDRDAEAERGAALAALRVFGMDEELDREAAGAG